jgi:hypothetical protein
MIRISTCFVLLLLTGTVSRAQDCNTLFKEAFARLKSLPVSSKGIFMKYNVRVLMKDESVHSDKIEVAVYDNRTKVVSDNFTIYQDSKAMVFIQNEAKTIFITSPAQDAVRATQLQNFISLQDSLFAHAEIKHCNSQTGNRKVVRFHFPSLSTSNFPLDEVAYEIDVNRKEIVAIKLMYSKTNAMAISAIEFSFEALDRDFNKKPFEGSAVTKVFDGGNKLKGAFAYYNVIDQR